jgi:hypothetical protein
MRNSIKLFLLQTLYVLTIDKCLHQVHKNWHVKIIQQTYLGITFTSQKTLILFVIFLKLNYNMSLVTIVHYTSEIKE